jgi:Spy/CpxP family protein refolding chaperone
MDPITKNRSLVSIIIFLLITNIAMVIFFLAANTTEGKSSHRDQGGMSEALQNEVGFTKDQIQQYQSLRKDHFNNIHPLFDDLRKSKMNFYTLIYDPQVPDSILNAAADLIAEKQKTLDMQMFRHFKMIQNICTPGQLQKFDSTIKKIFIRMISKTGKPNHDQKK